MLQYILGVIAGELLSAILCYFLSKKKNRNIILWIILGFIFGIITLVILLLIPKKESYEEFEQKYRKPDDNF